jgi:hypothetical protein
MERPVLGGPVPLGGQQAGPVGLRDAPPEQEDDLHGDRENQLPDAGMV